MKQRRRAGVEGMSLDHKPGWCSECQNTGMVDCYCGGDVCVCGEEEIPCAMCGGESAFEDDDALEGKG